MSQESYRRAKIIAHLRESEILLRQGKKLHGVVRRLASTA
jgi:hypothetical protein